MADKMPQQDKGQRGGQEKTGQGRSDEEAGQPIQLDKDKEKTAQQGGQSGGQHGGQHPVQK